MRRSSPLPRLLPPLAVAVGAVLFQLPFFDRWFSGMDEGHMLQYADILARGGAMYRDAYIYPLPGAFYLLAGLFRIFEPSILLSRCVVVVEFAIFAALVFVLMKGITGSACALLAVVLMGLYRIWAFPHWQIYSYSTTALLLVLATLLLAVRAAERPGRLPAVGAGLVAGLAVFCKQDYGGIGLLVGALVLVVAARTDPEAAQCRLAPRIVPYLGGAALVGLAAGLHFALEGTLGEAIRMTVIAPFRALDRFAFTAFPPLLPIFKQDPLFRSPLGTSVYFPALAVTTDLAGVVNNRLYRETAVIDTLLKFFYYGPWLIVAVSAGRLPRLGRELRDLAGRGAGLRELGLFFLALLLLTWVFRNRPQDYVHLAVVYWPILLLPLAGLAAVTRGRPRARSAALGAVALLAAVWAVESLEAVSKLRSLHSERPRAERAGVRVRPAEAEFLDAVVKHVEQEIPHGEPLAVLPYFPMLHFLTGRSAPHPLSYIVWPYGELPGRDARIIEAFDMHGVSQVLYHFNFFQGFPPVEQYAPDLFAYLVDHFEIDRVISSPGWGYRLAVLVREAGPPPGMALTPGGSGAVRVRVEGVRGRGGEPPPEPGRLFRAEVWPFRPVWALRPTRAAHGRTVLEVPLPRRVGAGARIATAVGVHPTFWAKFRPTWVRFELGVADVSRTIPLATRVLDPHRNRDHRGWFPLEVTLPADIEPPLRLVLATSSETEVGEDLRMAGWSVPRWLPSGESPE